MIFARSASRRRARSRAWRVDRAQRRRSTRYWHGLTWSYFRLVGELRMSARGRGTRPAGSSEPNGGIREMVERGRTGWPVLLATRWWKERLVEAVRRSARLDERIRRGRADAAQWTGTRDGSSANVSSTRRRRGARGELFRRAHLRARLRATSARRSPRRLPRAVCAKSDNAVWSDPEHPAPSGPGRRAGGYGRLRRSLSKYHDVVPLRPSRMT